MFHANDSLRCADGGGRTAEGGRRTAEGGRRTAEGGQQRADGGRLPTEHTEHTEGFLTGGNGESAGGEADGRRSVRPVPNPRAGKPGPRGMGFPAHVGATADRRSRRAAHAIWRRPGSTPLVKF